MSKKFDCHGAFRGIKLRVDPITGEANLRISFSDLRELVTSATLYENEKIEKLKETLKTSPPKYWNTEENLQYAEGYRKFLYGFGNWLVSFLDRPEPEPSTKEDRLKVVTAIREERLLIDSIIEDSLRQAKPEPKADAGSAGGSLLDQLYDLLPNVG